MAEFTSEEIKILQKMAELKALLQLKSPENELKSLLWPEEILSELEKIVLLISTWYQVITPIVQVYEDGSTITTLLNYNITIE